MQPGQIQGRGRICSTDNFFVQNFEYCFDPSLLCEAHNWNKGKAVVILKNAVCIQLTNITDTKTPYYIHGRMFQLKEVKGDLFSCPHDNSLVHCVSEDLHMSKGIAVLFKEKFGRVEELKVQAKSVGDAAVLDVKGRFIYYLITKLRYYQRPTYHTLRRSLMSVKSHAVDNQVTKLSMPAIGCGLDGLHWSKVSRVIRDVFKDTEVTVMVYVL